MNEHELTQDQREALQEVTNIGMGQAGAALANLLGTFVALSIPRIHLLQAAELGDALRNMVGHNGEVTAVRQSFQSDISGEAIVIYGPAGCRELWDLMGYDQTQDDRDTVAERELLFDVANVLIGACVCSVFEILGRTLNFSRPTLIGEKVPVDYLLQKGTLPWGMALLVEVNFSLENRQFTAHLVTLMAEESIPQMKFALDSFVESL